MNRRSSSTEVPSRLVKLAALTLVGVLSIVAALVLGEVALRLSGFSFPNFYEPDGLTGSRLRANMSGWSRREGDAFVRINSQGLRADREYALAKAPGTVRIAVLGDSFTQAIEVPAPAAFWAHLERELNQCRAFGERSIEVLNFGVSGYGTAQELLTLRHRVWRYSPDIVLLAFFAGNDVRNNSKRLETEKLRPFFVLRDGELVLDESFVRAPAFVEIMRLAKSRALLQDLRLYQLARKLNAASGRVRHNTPIALAMAKGERAASAMSEPGLDENVLREPQDDAWQEAWMITERLLLALAEEAKRGGARFILTTLSSSGSVYPNEELRKAYAAHLGVHDLFYPDRRIRSFAERHGIEVVTLGPQMQRLADATRTHYHGFGSMLGFGHWNPAGHEVAGRLIAQYICERRS